MSLKQSLRHNRHKKEDNTHPANGKISPSVPFSQSPSHHGRKNTPEAEQSEDHKGRLDASHQSRVVLRGDLNSPDKEGEQDCGDAHADHHTDNAHRAQ